jgi:hypothetical protein
MAVTSEGTLELTDTSVPIAGSVTVTCSGTNEGTVLPGGKDTTTRVTASSCKSNNSFCGSPTAVALGLPWKTQLVEVSGKLEDEITSASGCIGWEVKCSGGITDKCTKSSGKTEIENVAAGVDAIFISSEKATCTQSKKETGTVKGTVLNKSGEAGKKLEAS